MHLRRSANHIAWRVGNLLLPSFRAVTPITPAAEQARAVIVSFYMRNIASSVVSAQRQVLERFTPADVAIAQIRTRLIHSDSINLFLRTTKYATVLFLDIDCIPIRPGAIEALLSRAEAGYLAGSAQRSNHIDNGRHVYVAPSCMAISRETYDKLDRPSAAKTSRGDVAEEFTYAAEERGLPVDIHRPVQAEELLWPLKREQLEYGRGTTFENGFWHLFFSRDLDSQRQFVRRCDQVLANEEQRRHEARRVSAS